MNCVRPVSGTTAQALQKTSIKAAICRHVLLVNTIGINQILAEISSHSALACGGGGGMVAARR
tara:strand:+ start:99 stop:287 length:189 start_codon:yes stop_codon:yes gene_type:complete